jgi:putative adenylate-forming enzyme
MMQTLRDYRYLVKNRKHLTSEKITSLQLKELQKLLHYAKENSPYYKNNEAYQVVDSWDAFHHLPFINKAIMMEHFSDINTCGLDKDETMTYALEKEKNKDYLGYYKDEYVIGLSSGTSGNKGLYITPKSMTKRLPGVFLARGGVMLRDLPARILFCLRVFSQGFQDINAPLLKLTYASTMTPTEDLIQTMNDKKINILMAPPSMMRVLMPFASRIKYPLKKIITYAEVLSSADRLQFSTIFKAPVIEIYQASEGQIASPCKAGKLHINEDLVYVELYDENNHLIIEPHIIGHKMVLTNLINYAQPLIRYEMNDMIVLDEPCSCGSSFRTIEKIIGRRDDNLWFYDQNKKPKIVYADLFARWIITESYMIREFQVIQDDISSIHLCLDLLGDYDVSLLKQRLLHELHALGVEGIITLETVKLDLPRDANKFKRFISHVSIDTSST